MLDRGDNRWLAFAGVALGLGIIVGVLAAPGVASSFSVDDTSFYDGLANLEAFDATASAGVALDPLNGLRLATDGTPTVSTWSTPVDFNGLGAAGPLVGLLTAETTTSGSTTGAAGTLRLATTPLALDSSAANPILRPAFDIGVDRGDTYEVQGPTVVKVSGSDYRLYYTGVASDGYVQRIFAATSSDGVTWTKLVASGPGGCVLDVGARGSFDEYGLVRPTVVYDASSSVPFRMWYQGLGKDAGSIGYATSMDGTHWAKHEDPTGTPAPVLSPGVFGSADGYGVGEPSVSYDPATKVFRMWYAASPSPDVAGRQVGYATSSDTTQDAFGARWSKGGLVSLSGSQGNWSGGWFSPGAWFDPSSATRNRMLFAGKKSADQPYKLILANSADGLDWGAGNIILQQGSSGSWDSNNVFWADVLPDPAGSLYRIYYTGNGGSGDRARNGIGYGTWSGTGGASGGTRILDRSAPNTRFDANQTAQGNVWASKDATLNMFYSGRSAVDLNWRIGLATATVNAAWAKVDGVGDVESKAVFALGGPGSFDAAGALSASVAGVDASETTLAMAYEGVSATDVSSIGIATATPVAVRSWARVGQVLAADGSGFDAQQVGHPSLVRTPTGMRMYYAGYEGTRWEIGVSTPTAGITGWQHPSAAVLTVGPTGSFDSNGVLDPVVAYDPSSASPYRMWYTAVDGSGQRRVALALSVDGLSWKKSGLCIVPSGDPWSFDEIGLRAGGAWKDPASGTWHVFYDGIDRGNLGVSAGSPQVNWRRVAEATGKDAGYVSQGQGSYQLDGTGTPAPGYKYDFRDFSWDATTPAGSSARYEVSYFPAYVQPDGTPVQKWSPYVPLDGETKPVLPLTTEKVRWRVSLSRDAGKHAVTPTLEELRVTWAPVHFEATGTALSIPVGPTAGKYVDTWKTLNVSAENISGTTSATVTLLDAMGREILEATPLANGANSISLASLPPGVNSVRVRFAFSSDGLATPNIRSWGVSYISTHRAPPQLLQAFGTSTGAKVTWVEPDYAGYQKTRLLRRTDKFPTGPNDASATVVFDAASVAGRLESVDETGFAKGEKFFYAAFTSDGLGWSPPARTVAVVREPLKSLATAGLAGAVRLSWVLPASLVPTDTLEGVTVVRRQDAIPAGPADPLSAVAVVDAPTGMPATDSGAIAGTLYHYAAYLHDALLVDGLYWDAYSMPVTAMGSALWLPPQAFSAHGKSNQAVLGWTAPKSWNPTCTITVVRRAGAMPTGLTDANAVVVWSKVAKPGASFVMTDTGLVNYKPYWYAAYTVATSTAGARLVSPPAAAGIVPQGALGGFKTTAGNTKVTLTWSKPAYTGFAGVRVMRRIGAYPTGPTDPLASIAVTLTTGTSAVNSGLTNLTTYYYRAYKVTRLVSGAYSYTDFSDPVSARAIPKYSITATLKASGYKKRASGYYYYAYGRQVGLSGTISPKHAVFESGARGYVTVYVYKKRYSSKTRKYYWARLKTIKIYLKNSTTNSYWRTAYRPSSKGTYKFSSVFPGDTRHLRTTKTIYAKVN